MKNGSKRTISRVLAFVMLVSCMFTNILITNARISDIVSDDVVSGSAIDTNYKWSADDLALEDPLSSNPSLGGEIFEYSIISGKSKVTDNKKTFADGSSFENRLQMGGTGNIDNNAGVFTINAPSAGELYVYAITGSNGDGRAIEFYDASNNLITSETSGPIDDPTTYTYPVFVFDIAEAGTYKICSSSKGVNFYAMAFAASGAEETTEETTETTTEEVTETTTAAQGGEIGTPEVGKTYTADFAVLTIGDKLNGWSTDDGIIKVVSPSDGAYVHDGAHGAALVDGDQIMVAVAGNADIGLKLCQYGNGTEFVVTDSTGNVVGNVAARAESDGSVETFKYVGDATVLTFTLTTSGGEAYLHSVSAANDLPAGEAESFEFWLDDVAQDITSDTETDPETGEPVVTKTVEPGDYKFKDSTLTLLPGLNGEKYTPSWAQGVNIIRAGKTVNGYKAGNRPTECNAFTKLPEAGSAAIFTPAARGTLTVYFASTSFLRINDFVDGVTTGYTESETAAESYSIKVLPGHQYVISTTGKTNNMVYAGFEYVVDEEITVDVSLNNISANESSIPNLEVYLTDAGLGTVDAIVTAETTSVTLAKGHPYVVTTNDGGVKATINGSDTYKVADETPIVIDLEDIPDVTLTGKITGTPAGTVTKITFTNMLNGTVVEGTITGEDYTAVMKPGEYNTAVETNNGGETHDRVSVKSGAANVNEVYVEIPEAGNGAYYDLPTEVENPETKLTFNGVTGNNATSVKGGDGSSVVIPVTGIQKITVAGWYSGTWDINGTNEVTADSSSNAASPVTNTYITNGTEETVTVNLKGSATTYLYWIKVEDMIEFKSEISVPEDYATLGEAAAAIDTMVNRPEGEAGRVTINLNADTFEQVVFNAPYITLKGNGHTVSWYYGVGTFYYSVDPNTGLYNEVLFRDKYSYAEGNGSLWGGVAIIRGDNFIAEDTTFLNTYNYYVTDKEIEDIDHTASGIPARTKETDVTKFASKERSNAFYIEADNIEVYNCKILSSQDTLGRNGSANNNYHTYFKDCVIGGNVDYICGEFTAIFDNCELQWKTYSDTANNAKAGYIIAPKTSPYIFRNCTVTTDIGSTDGVLGLYGRTWGAGSHAYFIDTETNGTITEAGWGEMGINELLTAKFFDYSNTSLGRDFASTVGQALTDEDIIASVTSDKVIEDYLNSWRPVHYEYKPNAPIVWGDVNGDGEVNVLDVQLTLDYTLRPEMADPSFNKIAADVSKDAGSVNSEDVALILQKVRESTFELPVEKEEAVEDTTEDTTTEATTEDTTTEPVDKATVYVVGDSTACHYAPTADATMYIKRTGYGDKISDYINADVVNLALSGRSSKSFMQDPEYATLLNSVKEGDYVLIGFGHNDEKTEEDRYTAPGGTKEDAGTFKNSIYVNYILPVQEKGATPIIVTPIVRRITGDTWSGSSLHQVNGGDYKQDMIDLANELGLVCVDATTLTQELYTTLTPEGSKLLHAWNGSKEMSIDNTHLNSYGASYVSYLIANALKSSDSGLAAYVKDGIAAPATPAIEDLVNPDYKEPSSDDPTDLTSKLWKTTSPWYGSAFGNLGGNGKLYAMDENGLPLDPPVIAKTGETDNFKIEETAEGVNIRAGIPSEKQGFGKIEGDGKTDGLIMYYQPISAAGNFEIKGTITVNEYMENNQVAFGAIISDNMRIDTNVNENYQYVIAGAFRLADFAASTPMNAVTSYARIGGALELGPRDIPTTIAPGTKIDVSIKKIGNKFTSTYVDTASGINSVKEYTIDMEGDAYAGFFAARSADITVSNIEYNNEVVE